MALFIVANSGENHFVNACDKDRALFLIRNRLLKMFGKYNITDIQPVKEIDSERDRIALLKKERR